MKLETNKIVIEYKINLRTHFENVKNIFWCIILVFAGMYLHTISGMEEVSYIFLLGSISILVFNLAILLVLHLNYFHTNKNDVLLFDAENKQILFKHKQQEIKFAFEEIKELILHRSLTMNNNSLVTISANSNYHYAVIILNSGTKVIITSLLVGLKIDIPIDSNKIQIKTDYVRLVKNCESLIMA